MRWRAFSPTTTATIDLTEAVMTPPAAGALFGLAFTSAQALVILPVLAAAVLEIRRPRTTAAPADATPGADLPAAVAA